MFDREIQSKTGTWSPVVASDDQTLTSSNVTSGFIDLARTKSRNERNHHYTFDVEVNGNDMHGFVVEKTRLIRHRFKVYVDSDDDGLFSKSDTLIGKTKLRRKHSKGGAGGLLNGQNDGRLVADFISERSEPISRRGKATSKSDEPIPVPLDELDGTDSPNPIVLPCGFICESMLEERLIFFSDSAGDRSIAELAVDFQNIV